MGSPTLSKPQVATKPESLTTPPAAPAKMREPTQTEAQKQELDDRREAKKKFIEEDRKARISRINEPYEPPSKEDIAKVKALDALVPAYLANAAQKCKAGDAKVCGEISCMNITKGDAPIEEFITCYQSQGYVIGKFWAITSGKPDNSDPYRDKNLLEAAQTSRLKAGRHKVGDLHLACFRKKTGLTGSRVARSNHAIEEALYVSQGTAGPNFKRVYSLRNFVSDKIVKPALEEEFQTLDQLAEKTCAK